MNILIIEDNKPLCDGLVELLTSENYNVDAVHDGESGVEYGKSDFYNLIIVDLMLPKLSGFEVIEILREKHINIPILLLTARGEVSTRVKGLDLGADDYLSKPFSPDELLARIRALLRRPQPLNINSLSFCDLNLDLNSYTLQKDTSSIKLNPKEFELMKLLILYKGNIVMKNKIITEVWGITSDAVDNNVEVYISFLRKKLQFINSNVSIKTARKLGYFLEVSL